MASEKWMCSQEDFNGFFAIDANKRTKHRMSTKNELVLRILAIPILGFRMVPQ